MSFPFDRGALALSPGRVLVRRQGMNGNLAQLPLREARTDAGVPTTAHAA
jgi:hypothetical protein